MSDGSDEYRFTFERYRSLLERLVDAGATFERFEEREDGGSTTRSTPTVFLRHDVDWSPRKARRVARIEASMGVEATYFLLVSATAYNPLDRETRAAIADIEERGHAVGVHVDLRDVDSLTRSAVAERIERGRSVLAAAGATPAAAVSFHNPPEWVVGRALGLDGVVSTYAPRFVERCAYVADSNQRWRTEPPFAGGVPERVQVLTHPVLWGGHDAWTVDRLREERDYHAERLSRALARTDRTWTGPRGLGTDAFDGE